MKLLSDFGGVQTGFEYDHQAREARIIRLQDVEPIIERNKALQNTPEVSKQGIKEEWWRYASIPVIVLEMWHAQGLIDSVTLTGPEDVQKVQKLLRDPQWRYLKTVAGKTG